MTRDGFEWRTHRRSAGMILRPRSRASGAASTSTPCSSSISTLANQLYELLLGPVDAFIKDQGHLIVVPSGALTAVPFHLLVTEKPAAATPRPNSQAPAEHAAAYRDAAWLIKRQAVSVLPSVASLKPLRSLARKDDGTKPMIGFGDPVFNPAQAQEGDRRGTRTRGTRGRVRSYTDYWRGAGLDRAMLANTLPQLPDTRRRAEDGCAGARCVPGDRHPSRPRCDRDGGEARALANYRIVYFATHGLVAGDIKGLAEPSLALSLPAQSDRRRRWPAEGERGGAAQAQCRLGRALGLQHHCGRKARRGSPFRAGARLLLCRRARLAGLALGGRLGCGNAPDHLGFRHPQGRSERSDAPKPCGAPCWPSSPIERRPRTPIRRCGDRSR